MAATGPAAALAYEHGSSCSSMFAAALKRVNLPVAGVLLMFCFLYYVAVACVVLPWYSYSVPGVLHLSMLTVSTGMALYCYFLCIAMDPGSVPKGWQPDEEQSTAVQEVKKKDGSYRFCKKCNEFKPPRSHHCRVCERCVLRMDHHCPWVNNCIGHTNYRNFFLLLIYCSAALTHTTLLLAGHALHIVSSSHTRRVIRVGAQATPYKFEGEASSHLLWHLGLQTFAFAVALPTTIAVVMLLVWHIQMVAKNKTTIEHVEGVTAQVKAGVFGAERRRHPYDLGCYQNAQQILYDDGVVCCMPNRVPTPGGLAYPTCFDGKALGF